MLVLTDSSYTAHGGTRSRAREVALDEGRLAANELGVDELEVLDYPTLDVEHSSALVQKINTRIDEFRPGLILTHWPFDSHKSHNNTSLSTLAAARYFNSVLLYEPFGPGGRGMLGFRAQVYVDVSDSIEAKLAAIRAHRSEYEKYGQQWEEASRARATVRGFEMGSRHAEAFEVARFELKLGEL
jgi:LmbE family N-acetylglucosaminyl deacetylase